MGVLMKQPNGLYCIYSENLKRITDVNISAPVFVSFFCKKAFLDPKKKLERAFDVNKNQIPPNVLNKMSMPAEQVEWEEI